MKQLLKKRVKKTSISCFLILLFFGLGNYSAFAQEKTITGTVMSADGMILPGVNVIQKGTSNGVTTDFDGNYSINLKSASQQVLVYSFLGFTTENKAIGNNLVINIFLSENSEELDEVVVIGYGTAKKSDVLGSIGSVKSGEIEEITPVDATDALQGRIAGVQVVSNNGPGAGNEVVIRGMSTFYGGVSPLYVVDGQQMDNIDNIAPSDIASMEVLKDGASAAIYGSKSANGVILVTTKAGKSGVSKLDVNFATTISTVSSKIPVSNTKQKQRWIDLRGGGDGTPPFGTDSLAIRSQLVMDVQDYMYQPAITNQGNIAFSGGGENGKFYWNTSFIDEEGVLLGTDFKRFNSNLKVDFSISKKFRAGTRFSMSFDEKNGLYQARSLREMSYRTPDVLIYDFDGSYIPEATAISNPVAIALEATHKTRNFGGNTFNYIEWNITSFLKFKATLGIDFKLQKTNNFEPLIVLDATKRKVNGNEIQKLSYNIQQEDYITYNQEFKGGHKVSGLLGFSAQSWDQENSQLYATSFNNEYIQTYYNVSEYDFARTGSDANGHSLVSLFTRATYDYKGRYLFAGTWRRDGSSRFGQDTRWGNFPSLSLGWRLSRENFMESAGSIDELKFRGGYAITGNERIGNYDALLLYEPGYYYNGINGIAPYKIANDDLGWESTEQYNVGLDLAMFKRRLSLSVDAYVKTTSDLLYNVPIPQETGFNSIVYNIGSVENRGIDIELSGRPIVSPDFTWESSFNISFNKNEVTKLANEDGFYAGDYKIEVGQPLGNMYGYRNLGVYQYDESNAYANVNGENVQLTPNFDDDGTFQNYTLNGELYSGDVTKNTYGSRVLAGGDVIWEDLNNDNNIDSENDRQIVGNGMPDFAGGFYNKFQYKQLSLAILINYNFGNNIYRNYDWYRNRSANSIHVPGPERIDNAWVEQGDIAEYPTLRNRSQNTPGLDSKYVDDGDYIQFKNVRLGYTFDQNTLNQMKIVDGLSLYLSASNLLTFTNYEGYNPQIGNRGNNLQPGWDGLRYPNTTEIIFGLSVQF